MFSDLEQLLHVAVRAALVDVVVSAQQGADTVWVHLSRWRTRPTSPEARGAGPRLGALVHGVAADATGRAWRLEGVGLAQLGEVEAPAGVPLRAREDFTAHPEGPDLVLRLYGGGRASLRAWVLGGEARGSHRRWRCGLWLRLGASAGDAAQADQRLERALGAVLLALVDLPALESVGLTPLGLPPRSGVRLRLLQPEGRVLGGRRSLTPEGARAELDLLVQTWLELSVARGAEPTLGEIQVVHGRVERDSTRGLRTDQVVAAGARTEVGAPRTEGDGGAPASAAPESATWAPATGEPVSPEPATAEPATAEAATAEPVSSEAATAEAATAEPVSSEAATAEAATAEAATAEAATAEPVSSEPATAEAATAEPATTGSTTGEPLTGDSATGEPGAGESATTESTTGEAVTTEPAAAPTPTPPAELLRDAPGPRPIESVSVLHLTRVGKGSADTLRTTLGVLTLGQLAERPRDELKALSDYLATCWDQATAVLAWRPAVFPIAMQAYRVQDLASRTPESLLTLALYAGAPDSARTRAAVEDLAARLPGVVAAFDAAWVGGAEATLATFTPSP